MHSSVFLVICMQWKYVEVFELHHQGATTSAISCLHCDGVNVTCVDGECLPRCVNVTSSGECFQCRDSRFYGKQCENVCSRNCLNSACRLNNSRVVCTDGCVKGKKGDNCGVKCPEGCTTCERHDDNCIGPCAEGYYGKHCGKKCSINCQGSCDKHLGQCIRCKAGYQGNYCDTLCPSNCIELPNCAKCDGNGSSEINCKSDCPQNCKICQQSTGGLSTSKSSVPDVTVDEALEVSNKSSSSETLKLVCTVLGTMLCTLALIFIYKRCANYGPWNVRSIERSTSPQRNEDTKYRYYTEHSASSQYMRSKYWEIMDEDLESSQAELPVLSNRCGDLSDPSPLPRQHTMNSNDLQLVHSSEKQDKVLKNDFEISNFKVPVDFKPGMRVNSWGCETGKPDVNYTFPRPHSDSADTKNILFEPNAIPPSVGDGDEDCISKSFRDCVSSRITVQYITPNTSEIN